MVLWLIFIWNVLCPISSLWPLRSGWRIQLKVNGNQTVVIIHIHCQKKLSSNHDAFFSSLGIFFTYSTLLCISDGICTFTISLCLLSQKPVWTAPKNQILNSNSFTSTTIYCYTLLLLIINTNTTCGYYVLSTILDITQVFSR